MAESKVEKSYLNAGGKMEEQVNQISVPVHNVWNATGCLCKCLLCDLYYSPLEEGVGFKF